nr:MAG TPA: endonuclease [Caudoviricetes sp.]
MNLYVDSLNKVSEYVFENEFETNYYKLQKQLYYTICSFGLRSQAANSCIKEVISKYSVVETQLKRRPYKYKDDEGWHRIPKDLSWLQKRIFFKKLTLTLVANRDWSFTKGLVRITSLTGPVRCEYEHSVVDNLSSDIKLGGAKLVLKLRNKKRLWFLHISATRNVPEFDASQPKTVVGIDRGLRFITTSYDGRQTRFVSGKQILRIRNHYKKLRAKLQSKGTKSAKRRLKALSGRETRWMTDVNHRLSKALVQSYGPNSLFVLEDLTDISFERDLGNWAFYQFEEFLTYKAQAIGSLVLKVDAAYTSQRCPRCGKVDKSQRNHELHEYKCTCGYHSNDDRTGAVNIQELGRRWISGENNPRITRE